MVSTPTELIKLLRSMLAEDSPDAVNRLMTDLAFLPNELRRNTTAQLEIVLRIVAEERLKRRISDSVERLEAKTESVIDRLEEAGRRTAEKRVVALFAQAMESGRKNAPVNAVARRQAFWQLALGSALIFVIAWLSVSGAIRLGYVSSPALTESENRQLAWAKWIESRDRAAAVEWASTQLDSARKLDEARTAVDHLNAGNSLEAELQSYTSCQGGGRQIGMDTRHRTYCYYYLNPSEAPPWAAY